jgi:hypothetical protein
MNLIFVFFLLHVVYWLFENVAVVDIENQPCLIYVKMLILKMDEIFIYKNTLKKNQYCVIGDDERETNYDI